MTFDERVRALEPLGFSERQTRFLVTVALHSGFCLHRHYAAFAGLTYGAGVRDFFDRLVARKLATRLDLPTRPRTRLPPAPQRDLRRHRPGRQPESAAHQPGADRPEADAARLRARPAHRRLVCHRAGQGRALHRALRRAGRGPATPRLPGPTAAPEAVSTTRYFIHKLPIGLAGEPPTVSFAFLVTDTSGQAFAQFLRDHERLLHHLRDWRDGARLPPAHSWRARLHGGVPRLRRRTSSDAARPGGARGRADVLPGTPATRRRTTFARCRWTTSDEFRERHRRFLDARVRRTCTPGGNGRVTRCSPTAATTGLRAVLDVRTAAARRRTGSRCRYDRFGTRAGVS